MLVLDSTQTPVSLQPLEIFPSVWKKSPFNTENMLTSQSGKVNGVALFLYGYFAIKANESDLLVHKLLLLARSQSNPFLTV